MNMRFDLKYLAGGDEFFGPNYGGATIYTVTRKGYSAECPNMGRLLANLKFTLRGESEMMDAILDRHETPEAAATEWLKANPTAAKAWLQGVLTFDGRPAAGALARAAPTAHSGGFEQWILGHKIPGGRCHGGGHRLHQGARHLRIQRHLHRHSRHGRRADRVAARPARAGADRRDGGIWRGCCAARGRSPPSSRWRCCSSSIRVTGSRRSRLCRWSWSPRWPRPRSAYRWA